MHIGSLTMHVDKTISLPVNFFLKYKYLVCYETDPVGVYLTVPTLPEYGTKLFYSGSRARIETHARQLLKQLDSIGIPLMGRLRHQAMNSVLKAGKDQNDLLRPSDNIITQPVGPNIRRPARRSRCGDNRSFGE